MKIISQSQIQDFQQCPRRYYLRQVQQLTWPASDGAKASRLEQTAARGEVFHRFVHQLIQGIPAEDLLRQTDCPEVRQWMENFLSFAPLPKDAVLYSEMELSAIHAQVLWIGKFDGIAVQKNRLTIFDWKTSAHPAARGNYLSSPQTRLYRYLAQRCSARLSGIEIAPENIEMVYWFPSQPAAALHLPYDEASLKQDEAFLGACAAELSQSEEAAYPQSVRQEFCTSCSYFSFCHRDLAAAMNSEPEAEQESLPFELPPDEDRDETIF